MNTKRTYVSLITIVVFLLATAGLLYSRAVAESQHPALPSSENTTTFSVTSEFTGDIENDLTHYAQQLQEQGFSEAQIERNINHLRPALERSKYRGIETQVFSVTSEFTGDIENDLAHYAQQLQEQGFSEAQIERNINHLRPALERSKYRGIETQVFSVIVDNTDTETYSQKLQAQGIEMETIQALTDALREYAAQIEGVAPTARHCKTRTDGVNVRNALGQLLYTYSSSIHWCYNGQQITSLDDWEDDDVYWGWEYQGSTQNSSGGLGQSEYALHRNATMYHPILNITTHPSTHQRVYGDGTSWGNATP